MQTIHEYQGFGVNLKEISQILDLLEQDKRNLLEQSGFGDNKVRGLKDYLKDFCLADEIKNLSELGKIVKSNDKKLIEYFSKWLCLYHWSSKINNPILFFLINIASNGQKNHDLLIAFKNWAFENDIQTDYKKNYVAGLLSKTINSFIDSNAFQSLNLFTVYNDQLYRAEPYNVHPLLMAYVLYDNSRGRHSITISELVEEPGNLGKFFGYDMRTLDNRLSDLENLGLVKRVQVANLNMIELLYNGPLLAFVERYYNEY